MSALRLLGIVAAEGDGSGLPPGVEPVAVRELAAVVATGAHGLAGDDEAGEHAALVDGVFRARAVLPVPPGVHFRSRDAVVRWLELHYVTLSDALDFVEGRAEARVYLARATSAAPALAAPLVGRLTEEHLVDVTAAAAASFRVLRRHAVASTPLRPPEEGMAASAFLVERARWAEFADAVADEGRRDPDIAWRLTGPWPPWDFVKLLFGG